MNGLIFFTIPILVAGVMSGLIYIDTSLPSLIIRLVILVLVLLAALYGRWQEAKNLKTNPFSK